MLSSLQAHHQPAAILALADGTVFQGHSIGATGRSVGEVVFNTSMTGYQEILTDPSYCQQIVTLTYPHIGNTGVNEEDAESGKVHATGLVIRDLAMLESNFRADHHAVGLSAQQQYRCDRRHRHATPDPHPAPRRRAKRLPACVGCG